MSSLSEQAYSQAYKLHYNKKDYKEAYKSYLVVIRDYPDSNEARYAKQQIDNLKKVIDLDSAQLDSSLSTIHEDLAAKEAERIIQKTEYENKKSIETAENKAREQAIEDAKNNMILTTCPSIEGYRMTQQFGLVFGEILFKSGFMNRLAASFDNFADLLSFGDQEMTGTTDLLENARKYAINKMITQAAKKGANAIVGIDFESSAGGSIIHITVSGTAVRVEPIEK